MTKEELFALMEQIAEEREAALPVVEKLASGEEPIDDIEIPEGWRTAGMVLELCERAGSLNEHYPIQSLSFADLALAIAMDNSLADTAAKFLQGRAWKEIGYAHRYLHSFQAALTACNEAESKFAKLGLESYVAAAQLARASILFLDRRYDECLALNRRAKRAFSVLGIDHQEIKCDILEAQVAQVCGRFEVARDRCEALLKRLAQSDDLHTVGITYQTLGLAYRELGRYSEAVSAFDSARQIFVAANMPSEINRADHALADLLLRCGEAKRALPMCMRLREDYLQRKMPEDAGELGLMIADALVATGQVEWARAVVAQVLTEFAEAKLDRNVITALAYLRDLMQVASDPIPAIRRVRSYVTKARQEPKLLFLPLEN